MALLPSESLDKGEWLQDWMKVIRIWNLTRIEKAVSLDRRWNRGILNRMRHW
jgi:hypothetical protein